MVELVEVPATNINITDLPLTPESSNSLEDRFEHFISKIGASATQNFSAYQIVQTIVNARPKFPIYFEHATDEGEIIFVAESEEAQNILVLDSQGDIMLSHSPFHSMGWRRFIDQKETDFEETVYKFLSV